MVLASALVITSVGVMVTVTLLLMVLHGAAIAVVPVIVKVTCPAAISAAEGWYVVVSDVEFGVNALLPVPLLHL